MRSRTTQYSLFQELRMEIYRNVCCSLTDLEPAAGFIEYKLGKNIVMDYKIKLRNDCIEKDVEWGGGDGRKKRKEGRKEE